MKQRINDQTGYGFKVPLTGVPQINDELHRIFQRDRSPNAEQERLANIEIQRATNELRNRRGLPVGE